MSGPDWNENENGLIVFNADAMGKALPQLVELDQLLKKLKALLDGILRGVYGEIRWGDEVTAQFKEAVDPIQEVMKALFGAVSALMERRQVDSEDLAKLQSAAEDTAQQIASTNSAAR